MSLGQGSALHGNVENGSGGFLHMTLPSMDDNVRGFLLLFFILAVFDECIGAPASYKTLVFR